LKKFLNEITKSKTGFSSWLTSVGTTAEGTQAIQKLFGEKVFDFTKPPSLLRKLIEQATTPDGNDIILDFFAGSGTTAQAAMEVNATDGGNRKYILAQLPEPTGRTDFDTIMSLTLERVRRAGVQVASSLSGSLTNSSVDTGFRAYRLAPSNFIPWDGTASNDVEHLAKQLQLGIEHTRGDRTPDDLLYEILLKSWGEPALSLKIDEETIEGIRVFSIAEGAFLICLEETVNLNFIRAVADRKPDRVVMRESAFAGNDQLKANAVQTFKSKGVTSFKVV
jgi:adenine-specific DNA-methyltransferase